MAAALILYILSMVSLFCLASFFTKEEEPEDTSKEEETVRPSVPTLRPDIMPKVLVEGQRVRTRLLHSVWVGTYMSGKIVHNGIAYPNLSNFATSHRMSLFADPSLVVRRKISIDGWRHCEVQVASTWTKAHLLVPT
jgi:hypothetical protein